ncbi:MAG: hypothetical protein ABIK89_26635 [Planctomycetota bacterium]
MTEKKPQPGQVRTVLRGLGTLAAALGGGVALLAAIGCLFPQHQESRVLGTAIGVISLAMMAWAVAGIWLVIKGILGLR